MKALNSPKRIFQNTGKQIKRSGWLGWASVMVMALAFFIGTIFIALALASHLFLRSIENKPHIYVFFNAGTSENVIKTLNDKLIAMPEVFSIEYTDENGALSEFKDVQQKKDPELAKSIRPNVLPPSLGIRLRKIEFADQMINYLTDEVQSNKDILQVRYSKETIDTLKSLFYWIRMGGAIIIGLLMIVIFLFTLLTVEFRTFSRSEEIGIMQLVGGSLWFIRMPFILEGAFYGFLGALISSTIIYSLGYAIFSLNSDTETVMLIRNFLANISWPTMTVEHLILYFLGSLLLGFLIGAFNSIVAIRRYIY